MAGMAGAAGLEMRMAGAAGLEMRSHIEPLVRFFYYKFFIFIQPFQYLVATSPRHYRPTTTNEARDTTPPPAP